MTRGRRDEGTRGRGDEMTKLAILFVCLIAFQARGQQAWDTIPVLPDHYKAKLEGFQKQKASTGKIMFLGNSITEMGDFKKLLKDTTVINRGIGGDITFGVLNRLSEATRYKPSKIFILIGINDLSKGIPEETILDNMFAIIARIHAESPKTAIYVQSILPVNPTVEKFPKGYNVNESIERINIQLRNIQKRLKYTFIDLHKVFASPDQLMDVKYTVDGLHLNAAGYALWMKVLKDGKHL